MIFCLACLKYNVYTEEITREIKNSSYVSVQADETIDISCKSQFVIIVRYVKDFEPVCSVPKNCPHYVYSQSHKKSL